MIYTKKTDYEALNILVSKIQLSLNIVNIKLMGFCAQNLFIVRKRKPKSRTEETQWDEKGNYVIPWVLKFIKWVWFFHLNSLCLR